MQMESSGTQNSTMRDASIGTAALILGSYSLYKLIQHTTLSYNTKLELRESLLTPITQIAPVSIAASIACSGTWNFFTGERIWNSNGGLAALVATYTFPTALMFFCSMDKDRICDEVIPYKKSIITTASAAVAASLADFNKPYSNMGVAAFAATATFPPALTFFNCKAKRTNENDETILAKAASASVIAGACALLMNI